MRTNKESFPRPLRGLAHSPGARTCSHSSEPAPRQNHTTRDATQRQLRQRFSIVFWETADRVPSPASESWKRRLPPPPLSPPLRGRLWPESREQGARVLLAVAAGRGWEGAARPGGAIPGGAGGSPEASASSWSWGCNGQPASILTLCEGVEGNPSAPAGPTLRRSRAPVARLLLGRKSSDTLCWGGSLEVPQERPLGSDFPRDSAQRHMSQQQTRQGHQEMRSFLQSGINNKKKSFEQLLCRVLGDPVLTSTASFWRSCFILNHGVPRE